MRRCAASRVRQRWRWIEVRSLCRPGTRVNTARERERPRQDREEQRMVRRERTEVRGEEGGSTWLMSINTAKLVRWEQEHLVAVPPGRASVEHPAELHPTNPESQNTHTGPL